MQNLKTGILLIIFCLAAISVYAEDYKDPITVPAIGFRAEYKDGAVICTWKEYLRNDLRFYKVVKSRKNPNPVYPEDRYVYYTENAKDTMYKDKDIEAGVWYYSITIVTKDGYRWVAPAVKVIIPEKRKENIPVPGPKDFR